MSAGLSASIPLLGDTSTTGGGGGVTGTTYTDTLAGSIVFRQGLLDAAKRYNESDAFGIGVAPAQTPQWYIGRTIAEIVKMQPQISPKLTYGWTVTEQLYVSQALSAAIPLTIAENIGQNAAVSVCIGVSVLQALGIADSILPSFKYTQTLVQGIGANDALLNFFGLSLNEAIGQSASLIGMYRATPTLSDVIDIAPALSTHLLIKVTLADGVDIADANPLQMIFNGQLADGVDITVGYISPSGQFSTWSMNTFTKAVTEYSNYAFNSFAQIGDVYLGASSSGLYKLVGDTDDGANIVADIKSGYAEWGGSKFTMFEAAYLGVRGGGNYVLRVVTGDGRIYNYAVSARDMRTTKIHIGKGIRTRYFAFELTSSGQDFDLDNIEFVPLVTKRRV